ncbi:TPA: hypothetical protein TZW80_001813 [Streptococcus suis]|nr:hypothetical protein [Streptococcus suis]
MKKVIEMFPEFHQEILKKMLDGYYSKLPRHIIKDIINSYQEKIFNEFNNKISSFRANY